MVCPNRETLRRLLEGQLPEEQRTSLEGHVEGCSRCQRILDQLTNSVLPSELDEALHRSTLSEPRKPSIPDIELLEVIGRGSSGQVWKGRLLENQQLVAVKIILSSHDSSPEHLVRFQREIEILARLNHPNLIRLFHAGPISEGYFFSMEYVPAKSILDVRAREAARRESPKWSVQQIAAMVRDVAHAIQHAHENQVLHRDLKPGNILLAEGNIPKVADFSLGKVLDGSTRTTVGPAGTPCYMAPEQVRGEAATTRTDIYGIGALLYDWLTGQPPIAASETHAGTMQRVLEESPVSIRSLRPDVPADLELITLKCLQKIPSDRYASAKGVAEDLQRFLDHRPVLARPLSSPRRLLRWARRHPMNASLSTLLALSVFTGLIVTTVLWRRAEAKAEEARQATQAALKSRNSAREVLLLYSTKAERLYRTGFGITTDDRKALALAVSRTLEQLEADGDDPEQEWKVALSALKLAEAMHNFDDFESGERIASKVVQVFRRLAANTDDRRKIHDLAQAEAAHANLLYRAGRSVEAIGLGEIAIQRVAALWERYPNLYGFQITLASMRWHRGQFLHELGRQQEAWKDYAASLDDMRALLRRLPTHTDRLGEFQMVCSLYAQSLFTDPQRREQALAVLQEAVVELERFRPTAPKDWLIKLGSPESYIQLASIQYRLGKVDDAIRSMKQHVIFVREYRQAYGEGANSTIWMSGALSSLGELEWPKNPESATKHFREALSLLQDEIKRQPQKEVYFYASMLLAYCSDPAIRNPKLAVDYIKQAEQLDPQDKGVPLYFFRALTANQQYREALALREMSLPKAPGNWSTKNLALTMSLAEAKFRTGQVEEARELLQQIAPEVDRELSCRWEDTQRFEHLQKLILGIDRQPKGKTP
jgi:serine/threonine protein kinase